MVVMISLVFILVSEGFVDAFSDGLTVEDEAFCDWRLWSKRSIEYYSNLSAYKIKKHKKMFSKNMYVVGSGVSCCTMLGS